MLGFDDEPEDEFDVWVAIEVDVIVVVVLNNVVDPFSLSLVAVTFNVTEQFDESFSFSIIFLHFEQNHFNTWGGRESDVESLAVKNK